jgi:hypothetical protein
MATIVPSPHALGKTGGKPVSEEAALKLAELRRFHEIFRKLNETEPLPDNFIDIAKGRTNISVYSK